MIEAGELKSERGNALVEYSFTVTLIALISILAVQTFTLKMKTSFSSSSKAVEEGAPGGVFIGDPDPDEGF